MKSNLKNRINFKGIVLSISIILFSIGCDDISNDYSFTDNNNSIAKMENRITVPNIGDFPVIPDLKPSTWEKIINNKYGDAAKSIIQTNDGGYIAAGFTGEAVSGQPSVFQEGTDIYIVKLDAQGSITWTKTYGVPGYNSDVANSIKQTDDGGYIVAGVTRSEIISIDLSMIILKLDSNGNKVWERNFHDYAANSIQQTDDGGYIIAGYTYNHQFINSYAMYHSFFLKLNANGKDIWIKKVDDVKGTQHSRQASIRQTAMGDYIGACYTGFDVSTGNLYVVKFNSNGDKLWSKMFSDSKYNKNYPISLMEKDRSSCIIAGTVQDNASSDNNLYITAINYQGNMEWKKIYQYSEDVIIHSIQPTFGAGYVLAGKTYKKYSTDPRRTGISEDMFILKIDRNGNELWNKTYGESLNEIAYSIEQTSDEGFIVGGSQYYRGKDMYILKLDKDGNL